MRGDVDVGEVQDGKARQQGSFLYIPGHVVATPSPLLCQASMFTAEQGLWHLFSPEREGGGMWPEGFGNYGQSRTLESRLKQQGPQSQTKARSLELAMDPDVVQVFDVTAENTCATSTSQSQREV